MSRTCSHCRHWRRSHAESDVGNCRRYPPVPSDIEAAGGSPPRLLVLHGWPLTLANDDCGEFMSDILPATYPASPSAN